MSAIEDTQLGRGVGLFHWKESDGTCHRSQYKIEERTPFVYYYWKTVCCIRYLFGRLANKPFRLEINYLPGIEHSRPCTDLFLLQ